MKLHLINEIAADQRQQALKQLKKLISDCGKLVRSELADVCDDPIGMYKHALKGMQAKYMLFEDDDWWGQMFSYWTHIPDEQLKKFYEAILAETTDALQKAVESGVTVEGIGNIASGIISFLGKIAALFFLLMFAPVMKQLERTKRRQERLRKRRGGIGDEEYGPDPSGRGLPLQEPPGPEDLAGPDFRMEQLNPYIVYRFVEECVKHTIGEGISFDSPNFPEPDEQLEPDGLESTTIEPDIDSSIDPSILDTEINEGLAENSDRKY